MLLTPLQVSELLNIINRNQAIVLGRELGPEFLTKDDHKLLKDSGVDVNYQPINDTVYTSFHFGMLSEALGAAETRKLSYDDLRDYIKRGEYIPLNTSEKAAINTVRAQTFNDLKSLNGRIFQNINQLVIGESLKAQRDFIRDEIAQGVLDKKTVSILSNSIVEKTGDWSRDFDRIIAYNSELAYNQGKSAMMKRNTGGEDPKVYKVPFFDACNHCVKLYLANGIGSQPIIFKLSQLEANGTNIGRKTAEWLPLIGPVHPYCRCPLYYLPYGYVWDQKKQTFRAPENAEEYKPKRDKIRVWIGGVEKHV